MKSHSYPSRGFSAAELPTPMLAGVKRLERSSWRTETFVEGGATLAENVDVVVGCYKSLVGVVSITVEDLAIICVL
jgi:hypothetical protein